MRYIITRTSSYDSQPCEESELREFEFWHTRTCNEQEFDKNHSYREGLWRSNGKNHTITKEGWITRQQENKKHWSVEINSLEDLNKLFDKYGKLIISYDESAKAPTIEIYDDYRE